MNIHKEQRDRAVAEILGSGAMPMRLPIDLHLALHETASVFCLDIGDDWPGPHVRLTVDGWPCDYWTCLTYERAVERAARE